MTFVFIGKRARAAKAKMMTHKKSWKPGDIFASVTGKSITDCATIDDVDAAVSVALRLGGPMKFDGNDSGFVIRNGDVFPHIERSSEADIDRKVDASIRSS